MKHALLALLVACFVSLPQPSAAIRIPGILPCLPGVPRIPFVPCYETPPLPPLKEPAECWTPLEKLAPCAGFLTNSSVTSALGACCDGYQYVLDYAAICFCHYSNGDIAKIIPGPLNSTRVFGLSGACGSTLRLEAFITECNSKSYTICMHPKLYLLLRKLYCETISKDIL